MDYLYDFKVQDNKLANILDGNGLLHRFYTDRYPMQLVILQDLSPDTQMAMVAEETDGISSRDAKLVLTFPVGEIGVRTYGRLILSETLLGKIKNLGKKMRDLYLQGHFAALMEEKGRTPTQAELDDGLSDDAADGLDNGMDFSGFYDNGTTEDGQPAN